MAQSVKERVKKHRALKAAEERKSDAMAKKKRKQNKAANNKSKSSKSKKNKNNESFVSSSSSGYIGSGRGKKGGNGNIKNAGSKRLADVNVRTTHSSEQRKKIALSKECALDACASGADGGFDIDVAGTNRSDDDKLAAATLKSSERIDGHHSSLDSEGQSYYPDTPEPYDHSQCCDNCRRRHIVDAAESPFYMELYIVKSSWVKRIASPLRNVSSSYSCANDSSVLLCKQCKLFLVKENPNDTEENNKALEKARHNWENVWPSFYWNLLAGKDSSSGLPFHVTYDKYSVHLNGVAFDESHGHYLWKFIPKSIRGYWLHALSGNELKLYYGNCNIESPPSYFSDCTDKVMDFRKNINEYTYKALLRAIDPCRLDKIGEESNVDSPNIMMDVLCPWGCCDFSFQCEQIYPSLLIQTTQTNLFL